MKLERARAHRNELEQVVREFGDKNPYRLLEEDDPHSDNKLLKIRLVQPFPSEQVSVIVGDCLNNLNTALDHAIFHAAFACGVTSKPRYIKFPSGSNKVNFESSCKGMLTPYSWLTSRIVEFGIYPGGSGERLYRLMQLNNTDKHQFLIPSARAIGHPSVKVESASGVHGTYLGNVSVGDNATICTIPPGAWANVDGAENFPIFVTFAGGIAPIGLVLSNFEKDVLFVIHVLETMIEAAPHVFIPQY